MTHTYFYRCNDGKSTYDGIANLTFKIDSYTSYQKFKDLLASEDEHGKTLDREKLSIDSLSYLGMETTTG